MWLWTLLIYYYRSIFWNRREKYEIIRKMVKCKRNFVYICTHIIRFLCLLRPLFTSFWFSINVIILMLYYTIYFVVCITDSVDSFKFQIVIFKGLFQKCVTFSWSHVKLTKPFFLNKYFFKLRGICGNIYMYNTTLFYYGRIWYYCTYKYIYPYIF